jgi:hypothetical protein
MMSVMSCDVDDEAMMSALMKKRPRNDDHIISPNSRFAPLRTAYNSEKPSNLQGLGSRNPHIFPISSSQRHNTLQIRFEQVGCDPAKYQNWRENYEK